MRKLILIVFCFALVRCNDSKEQNPASPSGDSASTATPKDERPVSDPDETLNGCYLRVLGKDSFSARLQQQGDLVTGDLFFNNYEKDKSRGTVNGRIDSSIIKLLYTFQSEGTTSVMEVYFKKTAGGLIPGTGDMKNHGDTVVFSKPGAVSFAENDKWNRVECR